MRVLALFASAFAAGMLATFYLLPAAALLPVFFGGVVLTTVLYFLRKYPRLVLLGAGFCAAFGYYTLYEYAVRQPFLLLAETEQTVTMTLCDYPEETDWGARVSVRIPGHPLGKVLYYGGEELLVLSPGQKVTDEVSFRDASYIRGEEVTTFLSKGIYLLAYGGGEALLEEGNSHSLRYLPLRARKAMQEEIRRQLTGDEAGLLTALLTGETETISEAGRIALSEAGLSHILAVSGMHCGFLYAMAVFFIGRHRRRFLASITIMILVFYVILTGASPSVVRACVMLSFVLLAPVFRRESDGFTSLSAALLLILLANPYAVASLSLQLSFAAMAGMLTLPGRIWKGILGEGRHGRAAVILTSSFASTMGALVFTVPLTAIYFGTVTLISPLSNLLCLWSAGLAFSAGLVSIAAGLIFPPLGQILSVIPGLLCRYILAVAGIFLKLPFHSISFSNLYLKYWLAAVYAVFFLVWCFGPASRRKYAAAAILSALALFGTVKAGELRYQSGLDVVILNVGQGQCIVLKSGEEFALVDCGSAWADAGDIAFRQLQAMGCKELDYLILTHYDNDHISGTVGLLTRQDTRCLIVTPEAEDASVQEEILTAAEETEIINVYNRRSIPFGEAEIVVYPPLGEKTDNERGISVRVSSGEDSVFITGDMSQETERLLLRTYALEESDVLVVGHHGARNSTSQALLDALEPSVACISVGSNSYGHPHTETLERLAQQGCEIYRTDMQGDIHLSLNP